MNDLQEKINKFKTLTKEINYKIGESENMTTASIYNLAAQIFCDTKTKNFFIQNIKEKNLSAEEMLDLFKNKFEELNFYSIIKEIIDEKLRKLNKKILKMVSYNE